MLTGSTRIRYAPGTCDGGPSPCGPGPAALAVIPPRCGDGLHHRHGGEQREEFYPQETRREARRGEARRSGPSWAHRSFLERLEGRRLTNGLVTSVGISRFWLVY